MIHPRHQHRFTGDSGVDIASYTIDVVFPDGERRPIVLRLGAPFQRPGETNPEAWWIRSELENLDSTDGPLAGGDSLHAIVYGVRWMVGRLAVFEKAHGCRYYFAGTSSDLDYRKMLGTNWPADRP